MLDTFDDLTIGNPVSIQVASLLLPSLSRLGFWVFGGYTSPLAFQENQQKMGGGIFPPHFFTIC